jgi:hypothetical protein
LHVAKLNLLVRSGAQIDHADTSAFAEKRILGLWIGSRILAVFIRAYKAVTQDAGVCGSRRREIPVREEAGVTPSSLRRSL